MPTDALATLGVRASAGMILTPKNPEYLLSGIKRELWRNKRTSIFCKANINGLMQEGHNSIAKALELCFLALTHRYPTCWCPGDTGSQGISKHGMEIAYQGNSRPQMAQLKVWYCYIIKANKWGECNAPQNHDHMVGLVQYCSIPSALAIELLQSCTKPSNYTEKFIF